MNLHGPHVKACGLFFVRIDRKDWRAYTKRKERMAKNMHIHQEMNERFPVRNTKEQKQEFRAYIMEKAQEMGYSACMEATDKKGNTQNVVVSDAERAAVIFTAHYDTPRRAIMPNLMMPRSPLASVGYALLLVVPLLFVSLGARYLAVTYLHLPESIGMLIYWFSIIYFLLSNFICPLKKGNGYTSCTLLQTFTHSVW